MHERNCSLPPQSSASTNSATWAYTTERYRWSEKRDSNPRPQPWQGCTPPLSHSRIYILLDEAGDGNRTHVSSLEGWCSTIELHPHVVGVTGFEPATSWSQTRRSSQAEPHPEGFVCVLSVTQELVYSKGKNMSTTFFIFFIFF